MPPLLRCKPRLKVFGFLSFIIALGCQTNEETPTLSTPDAGASVPIIHPELDQLANGEQYSSDGTPGHVSLRRLTRIQYRNAIKDIFGDEISVPKILEPDVAQGGLRNVGASEISYSPRGVESIEEASYAIAAQVVEDESIFRRSFPCQLDDQSCVDDAFIKLATKIFRRPPTEAEVLQTKEVISLASERLSNVEEGISFGIAALLQSPHFLFRTELGMQAPNTQAFSSYEMAARLSFFLWNTIPDDQLLELARNDALQSRSQIYDIARQMMDDPRFKDGMRAHFDDVLELYELDHLSKDPKVFEHFDPELGPAAAEETWRLIESLVFDEPRDFRDLLTAKFTFANPRLATIYGLPAPREDGFGRLPLDFQGHRAGLLGHTSFLALHSHATSTSATRRGEAVRTRLLCQSIPSPPVNVDTSIPEPTGTRRTLRERVDEHLSDPSCVACHQLTDPIGLGLENYDAIGRFRTLDNGALIDPSGNFDGIDFYTPIELGALVREHPNYAPCVVQKLVEYGIGRSVTSGERSWLTTLVQRFSTHGFLFQPLVLEFVTSPLFMEPGLPLEDE